METLGIDIGGTGIKGAPVRLETGALTQERRRIPTPQPATPEAVAGTVRELCRQFAWDGPVGCGFPAAILHGVVRTAANVDESWIEVPGERLFAETTGLPVTLINDADAAGIAEMRFGAGKDQAGVVLLLTIGTGIGSALFTDGRLVPNTELGHILIKGMDAEHWASDAARKREGLSWKRWAARFNRYMNYLDGLLWPDLIILGGGAAKKHVKFLQYFDVRCPVVPAQFLNEAGIVGAALAAGDVQTVRTGN